MTWAEWEAYRDSHPVIDMSQAYEQDALREHVEQVWEGNQ